MINPFDDIYFMKKALQEAELAFEKGEVPVGAVIVINDKIVARGHNLTETFKGCYSTCGNASFYSCL